jgi:hypothetical protein
MGADYIEGPTRKDIATSFTRKIIFDEIPNLPLSHSYRALEELVIVRLSDSNPEPYVPTPYEKNLWVESRFEQCLKVVAPSIGAIKSLYVKLYIRALTKYPHDRINALFYCFDSVIPCIYEISDIGVADSDAFYAAYDLQCVVHLKGGWRETPECRAKHIASHINECFEEEDLDTPTGQLFLCDIPSYVLDPQELASADDLDEAAINKICDLVSVYPDLTGSIYKTKLDFFRSRIKLVKSGFKPSLSDLYPRPQPRSVVFISSTCDVYGLMSRRGLSAVMLPDDFVFVPDDEWSLTDDEPMDSEAEYSGSETSGYDSGSDSEMEE